MQMPSVVNVRGLKPAEQRGRLVYVGRRCYGWDHHRLANPFKFAVVRGWYKSPARNPTGRGGRPKTVGGVSVSPVEQFFDWLDNHQSRAVLLGNLWDETEQGRIPLGCWCVPKPWTCPDNPGELLVSDFHCHAQVIAVELALMFVCPEPAHHDLP